MKTGLIGVGEKGIKMAKYVSNELDIKTKFFGKNEENSIIIPGDKLSLIASEKVDTEFDKYIIDHIIDFSNFELVFIISDLSELNNIDLTKVIGKFLKKLNINTMSLILIPFKNEISKFNKINDEFQNILKSFNITVPIYRDNILKAFKNFPLRLLENIELEIILFIIKTIYESLSFEQILKIINSSNGIIGFGIGITERMDKILDSVNEALSSPWLSSTRLNKLIIFNGNLIENDIKIIKEKLRDFNYEIIINRNLKQYRRIDILILDY